MSRPGAPFVSTPTANVSRHFRWNRRDASIVAELLAYEATPEAVAQFAARCDELTDYAYWFVLGTLWVSYTGGADLVLWRRLFESRRGGRGMRKRCLMQPDELDAYEALPGRVTCYRAHRPGEVDWLSYTLSRYVGGRFALERSVADLAVYQVPRRDVVALFLRRGEHEVIVLDRARVVRVGTVPVTLGMVPQP